MELINVPIDSRSTADIARQVEDVNRQILELCSKHEVNGSFLKALGYGDLADRLVEIRDDLEAKVQQLSLF